MIAMAEKEFKLLKRLESNRIESPLIKVLECSALRCKERALSEVETDGPSMNSSIPALAREFERVMMELNTNKVASRD